ncbi:hypothetical protein LRP88_12689 [Fusarium phalaenopsidis]
MSPSDQHQQMSMQPYAGQQQVPPEVFSPGGYRHRDLADLLGVLKIDETGTAPYLRTKTSFRQEEQPAIEDSEDYTSALKSTPGLKIRIPPELMPDDETALRYFDLYFDNVHPYVPVLCKTAFYQQWNTDREAISPLILEAIFAIGGRLAEEPTKSQQWLALASRHADYFMDVPRLSTLQALLMILKAREAAPRRGYYYRSWMTVMQCVQMGKDLGLDEHYDHQTGHTCDCTPAECQLRTRIWQVVFVCEVMVGAPQGRHDRAVSIDSVDLSPPKKIPGCDDLEYHVSHNFTYFAQVVRIIATKSKVYQRLRRCEESGTDPKFQQLGQSLNIWLAKLPAELAMSIPQDGSPPRILSHFVGNMHAHYHLAVILFHRPILSFLDPNAPDGQWKRQMMICYRSANALCRLQETTLDTFGLTGLQCMQRGFSFSLYSGLSCIVIQLAAIVSPDPDFNTDAREFFTRHMAVLEKAMEAWCMPELEEPFNALREAFSADVRQPFVLKPMFPDGSPVPSSRSSSPPASEPSWPVIHRSGSVDQHLDTRDAQQVSYASHPTTPPISAGPGDSTSDSPVVPSLVLMLQGTQAPGMPQRMPPTNQSEWGSTRISDYVVDARTEGLPVSTYSQITTTPPQTSPLNDSSSSAMEVLPILDIRAAQAPLATGAWQLPPPQYSTTPVPNFVTPAMWQESVASVYEGGTKRSWDYDDLKKDEWY